MHTYSLSQLSDSDLLAGTRQIVSRDCFTTAGLLAHLAEIDTRKLYLPAAYPSMFAFCVHELHMSEDSALKRIQAARKARQFPAIFDVVADGRLHLTGLGLLAPHLIAENAEELLRAAAYKTKAEIELLLAERFPRTELLPLVETIPRPELEHAPGHVAAAAETQHAPAHVEAPAPRAKVSPIACQRFGLQVSVGQDTHDKLRYAQALFSHQIPAGDVAQLLDRALDALIREGEKGRFAATEQPQRKKRLTTSPRHIPAHVKRAVWERD